MSLYYLRSYLTSWFVSLFSQDLLACILRNILKGFMQTHHTRSSVNYVFFDEIAKLQLYFTLGRADLCWNFPILFAPDIYRFPTLHMVMTQFLSEKNLNILETKSWLFIYASKYLCL